MYDERTVALALEAAELACCSRGGSVQLVRLLCLVKSCFRKRAAYRTKCVSG